MANSPENKAKLPVTFATVPVVASGSIEAYIAFVNSIPMLKDDEEYQLAEQWRLNEDVEAARYLVLTHLRLVVALARTYNGYGIPLADLIQEGTIGLMKAVKRFDLRRNVRLATFALYWIRAAINDYVIKNWHIVKTVTTNNQRKLFFNLRSMRQDANYLSNDEAKAIAKQLNVTTADVKEMHQRLNSKIYSTHNEPDADGEEKDIFELIADHSNTPEQLLEQKTLAKLHTVGIESALEKLDTRSRDIIYSRWLLDEQNQATLQDLATKYNISAERVRQIEVKALAQMKNYLQDFQN